MAQLAAETSGQARDPDLASAPVDRIEQRTCIGFRNRIVLSATLAWELTPRATLRAGYSYNGQIQPDETLSPIFSLIARRDTMRWACRTSCRRTGRCTPASSISLTTRAATRTRICRCSARTPGPPTKASTFT